MSPPPYTIIPLHQMCTAYCVHWFGLFVSKTMSPPPYTTIPLHPLHTASTSLTFSTKGNVPITIYHYSMCPLHTEYCIDRIHWTFLYQRQCSHHHIPLFHCVLHPLCTASTAYCIHCVHCVLCPLCTASTPSSHFCVILTQPDIYTCSSIPVPQIFMDTKLWQ